MLTARSEYRLFLRADNAVSRLGPMAIEIGSLRAEQSRRVLAHLEAKRFAESALEATATGLELGISENERKPLTEWARRDDAVDAVRALLPPGNAADEAISDAAYAPYLARQRGELAARSQDRSIIIPAAFDYERVPGLSNEMRERLEAAGPADLDQAARIAGVTPAALSALHFALAREAA